MNVTLSHLVIDTNSKTCRVIQYHSCVWVRIFSPKPSFSPHILYVYKPILHHRTVEDFSYTFDTLQYLPCPPYNSFQIKERKKIRCHEKQYLFATVFFLCKVQTVQQQCTEQSTSNWLKLCYLFYYLFLLFCLLYFFSELL